MFSLANSAAHWGDSRFQQTFVEELSALGGDVLPLQANLSHGSVALDHPCRVVLLRTDAPTAQPTDRPATRPADDQPDKATTTITIAFAVFYESVIAGCNCADDPSPPDTLNEYCELRLELNTISGEARLI